MPLRFQQECSICLGQFVLFEVIYKTGCHHLFHLSCLNHWMRVPNFSCPLCRCDISRCLDKIEFKSPHINYHHALGQYKNYCKWGFITRLSFREFVIELDEFEQRRKHGSPEPYPSWYQALRFNPL